MADGTEDPKAIMDQCVQQAVTSGRESLHTEDPLANFQVTGAKSNKLQEVLDLLDCNQHDQIAHDNHKKYVLNRNGSTSFVYLADAGSQVNGMRTVAAQWFLTAYLSHRMIIYGHDDSFFPGYGVRMIIDSGYLNMQNGICWYSFIGKIIFSVWIILYWLIVQHQLL